MPLSPAERTALGQIGNAARQATEDPREMTAAAREGLWKKFYDQTDWALPEAERERQARALRDGHMARMRLALATARRKKQEAAEAEEAAKAALDQLGA